MNILDQLQQCNLYTMTGTIQYIKLKNKYNKDNTLCENSLIKFEEAKFNNKGHGSQSSLISYISISLLLEVGPSTEGGTQPKIIIKYMNINLLFNLFSPTFHKPFFTCSKTKMNTNIFFKCSIYKSTLHFSSS